MDLSGSWIASRRAVLAAAALVAASSAGIAQQGPGRIVVGFPAGGSSDTLARLVAEKLEGELHRKFIVENRVGAGGRIAAEAVKNAPPDGATILLANTSMMVIAPVIYRENRYDAVKDFTPLTRATEFQVALATANVTGAKDFPALMEWMKANPDKASIGVPAPASLPHLYSLAFTRASGLPLQVVAFQGGAPLAQNLSGGHVATGVSSAADFARAHTGGLFRLVAASGTKRHPTLPDVPTFSELGIRGMEANGWDGFFLPAGADAALAARYAAALRKVLAEPDIVSKVESFGQFASPSSPAELHDQIVAEQALWRPVIEANKLQQ